MVDSVANVFIGYDAKETVAYHVLAASIMEHSSIPVRIAPIALHHLNSTFTRERNPLQSTDFSFSRFLTPYLSNYEGWSLFLDCDMLFRDDIAKLWALRDEDYAVQVVKHDHQPKESIKFLGQTQTQYEKKNWSSVMLMNNKRCTELTKEYVNKASGLELHQFKWLKNDELIGEIPRQWNHLVGYYNYSEDAANIHFTEGGPYFQEYKDCEYSDEWFAARDRMLHCQQLADISDEGITAA